MGGFTPEPPELLLSAFVHPPEKEKEKKKKKGEKEKEGGTIRFPPRWFLRSIQKKIW